MVDRDLRRERARLYDDDARDTLRYGAPLVALLLILEAATHLPDGSRLFTAAALVGALLVAPLGVISPRLAARTPLPIRYWPLWIWFVSLAILAAHIGPFSHESTTYLIVAYILGCAALISTPAAFAISAGTLVLVLLGWLIREPLSRESSSFALACIPLALALYWARRRSLLLGERQRALEQALARQRDEVEMARRILSINRGLTHHFDAVFSGIVGGASLALEQLEPEHPARAAIARALSSGEHGSEIIERLGLSGDDDRESPTAVDPAVLLRSPEITSLLPPSCRFEVVTRGEPPLAFCQRERLKRALRELVANAVEAIGEEEGAISVELRPGEDREHIEIVVIDSGAGMDDRAAVRGFEPFYSTRAPGRRGLGLTFVMGFLESAGGTIRIDSRPGRGTRVRLVLPASAAEGG